ncbi:MAG TPA: sigma factor-like helix-turn-helix DNA-binding protein [Solirubrobacteraceae bacterium]|jgi:hypothetical protein|nr:sigma factor-like helix-turn-helix DNA-binding protein [Solirubrobacteraceae bacterium]
MDHTYSHSGVAARLLLTRESSHFNSPTDAELVAAADRDALLLLAWADLDYEQIGQALDVPLGTVRSRIHRARQRVRDHLDTYDDRALNEA